MEPNGYLLPACLPFKNYLVTRSGEPYRGKYYHVDFVSDVPRDYTGDKEVQRISQLPVELCFENNKTIFRRALCSTGCGFHSGAPTLVHEHTGHWSLVALAQGGPPCPDPLRYRHDPHKPRHTLLRHYVPWITSKIIGRSFGGFDGNDPFGFVAGISRRSFDWQGRWWMGGMRCFDRGPGADDIFKFYHEMFRIKPSGETSLAYHLEIHAAHMSIIVCVKVGMPFQFRPSPKIWGINQKEVKLLIPVPKFENEYKFQVEAWARTVAGDSSFTPEVIL